MKKSSLMGFTAEDIEKNVEILSQCIDNVDDNSTAGSSKSIVRMAAVAAAVAGLCVFAPQAEADDLVGLYNTSGTREYNFSSASDVYTIESDLEEMAYGEFTINGVIDDEIRSTIDADGYELFKVNNGSTLNISNVEIKNGYVEVKYGYSNESGGAIYNYGTIEEITNTTFTSNSGGVSGGAVYNNGAIGEITGSTFTSNNAQHFGGAIVNYGTTESIIDTIFTYNSSISGGAILNWGNSTIEEINDSTFTSNSAMYGGAINNIGAIEEITNSTFTSNSTSKWAYSDGGAIYNNGGTISEITNSTFTSNSANNRGGAIHNGGTIGKIEGTFTNNLAGGSGGAIYSTTDLNIVAETADTLFSGNKQGVTFTYDNDGNITGHSGGTSNAIYMTGGQLNLNAAEGRTITFDDAIVTNNQSYSYEDDYGYEVTAPYVININNPSVNSDAATGTVVFNNQVGYNNVYLYGGTLKLGSESNSLQYDFANDHSTGVVWVQEYDTTFDVMNGSISPTKAYWVESGDYTLNLKLDVDITDADNATADRVFAPYNGSRDVVISDVNFMNLNLEVGQSAIAQVIGGYSEKHLAVAEAIQEQSGLELWLKDSEGTISNNINWSTELSGATWEYKTVADLKLEAVSSNDDDVIDSLKVTLLSATPTEEIRNYEELQIDNNLTYINELEGERSFSATSADETYTVTANLGTMAAGTLTINGIYDENTGKRSTIDANGHQLFIVHNGSILNLNDVTIKNGNTTSNGGAVYSNGTIGDIVATFIGNNAYHGGAIHNSGNIELIKADFTGNSADLDSGYGGAIHNNSTIEGISNSTFTGNIAGYGGAIYNSGTISEITNSTFDSNSALYGGAIENFGSIDTILADFIENSANSYGGAIANFGNIESIKADFTFNSANNDNGGAIYNHGTIGKIEGTFTNNLANRYGGAIYSTTDLNIVAETVDTLFSGNKQWVNFEYDDDGNIIGYNGGDTNAIYMDGYYTSLNLNAAEGRTITFNDEVRAGYNGVHINNPSVNPDATTGTIVFNDWVYVYNANLYGGTLKLGANEQGFKNTDGGPTNVIKIYGESTLDVQNDSIPGAYKSYRVAFGSMNNTLHAKLDVRANGDGSAVADMFRIMYDGEVLDGVFEISDINFIDDNMNINEDSIIRVLEDENGMLANGYVTMTIADSLSEINAEIWKTTAGDMVSPHLKWTDSIDLLDEKYQVVKQVELASSNGDYNDSITIKTLSETATGEKNEYTANDTLVGINLLNSENRSFTSNYAGEVYTMQEDMSTTAAGTFTVKGLVDGDEVSTIDANGHSMFQLRKEGTVLNLTDLVIKNASSNQNGAVVYAGAGTTVNINNVSFENNSISADSSNDAGYGLVYNEGIIDTILASFSNNSVSAGSSNSYSANNAVLVNSGAINMIKADFKENMSDRAGAALANNNGGFISEIIGSFEKNDGSAYGGAIANFGNIASIKADFKENTAGMYEAGGTGEGGAIANGALYGSSYYIGEIIGTFSDNKTFNSYGEIAGSGGAIVNRGTINTIKADFLRNQSGYGGAIYNNGTIGEIVGIFHSNHAGSDSDNAYNANGGAIYNSGNGALINALRADFVENVAEGSGGAIYNNGTINEIVGIFHYNRSNNDSTDNAYGAGGGAIFNNGNINMLKADFVGNVSKSNGGAISNTGFMHIVDSNFTDNIAAYNGGAIFNQAGSSDATINIVAQDKDVLFAGNMAGGVSNAIYNAKVGEVQFGFNDLMTMGYDSTMQMKQAIDLLNEMITDYDNGDMDSAVDKYNIAREIIRVADNGGQYSYERAYNEASNLMYNIDTNAFLALNNLYTRAQNVRTLYGQFIYNAGMGWTDAEDFLNESSRVEQLRNMLADNNNYDSYFSSFEESLSYAQTLIAGITEPLPETGPVFNYTATINLNAAEGRTLTINDGISGGDGSSFIDSGNTWATGKGVLNINKPTYQVKHKVQVGIQPWGEAIYEENIEDVALPNGGTVVFNETVQNNDLNVYAGTLHLGNRDNVIDGLDVTMYGGLLNTINNQTGTVALNTLTLQNDFNMAVDVDLANEKMDRLTANNYNLNDHKVNVVGMNLMSDMSADKNELDLLFADNDLKEYVTTTIDEHTIEHSYQSTAYSPIYKYTVQYKVQDDGGFFNFVRGGMNPTNNPSDNFNPAVLDTPVVQQANVLAVQNVVNNYAFHHADSCPTHGMGSLSGRYANRYALGNDQLIKDDLNTNNPLFVKPDQESVWVKPFVTFENIPLRNGPKVNSTTYGTLIGYDSNPKYYKRGFEGVWSGYIGYTGSNIHYSGVDSTSNGGLLGTTFSLYKGNFFNATTLTAGAMLDQASTMYGKDNITTLYAGVGNKVGYNLRFKEDLFVLQPSLLLSYTFGNTFDYTNAAGVRINSDPIHSIQISPGVKFYMNTKSGWQPYLGVNMMWNIMDQTHVRANGVKLPEMSIKPYVQYGIGVQKTVKDHFTAYGQAMIQNGGRNGISLTMGFKWAIGKNKNKIQKVQNSDKKIIKTVKSNNKSVKFNKVQKEQNGAKHILKG